MTTAMNTDRKDIAGILLRRPHRDPTRAAGLWFPEIRRGTHRRRLPAKNWAVQDLAPTLL
jgi:hypothetical protein